MRTGALSTRGRTSTAFRALVRDGLGDRKRKRRPGFRGRAGLLRSCRGQRGRAVADSRRVNIVNPQGTQVARQDKHHLNSSNLDDIAAMQQVRGIVLFESIRIDLEPVAALHLEEPAAMIRVGVGVGIEINHGSLARKDLGRAEVNMHKILVVGVAGYGLALGNLGGAANVHDQVFDEVGPFLCGDLGIRGDVAARVLQRVGMVLTRLRRYTGETLRDLGYQGFIRVGIGING